MMSIQGGMRLLDRRILMRFELTNVLILHLHNQHQFRLTLGTHCAALSIIVGYNSIPANV